MPGSRPVRWAFFRRKRSFPLEVPFRVFVGIAFAGTIAFHLVGLGVHTYIGHQKSQLVSRIESLSEIRTGLMGLESGFSVLRERTGRILDRSGRGADSLVSPEDSRKIFSRFHVMGLLLEDYLRSSPDPALEGRWKDLSRILAGCRPGEGGFSRGCLDEARSRLSGFLGHVDFLRTTVFRTLVEVEERQSRLEHWDTILYWITTVLGLLFMAMSWRNVVLQVGNPIGDVTHYLESYQERSSGGRPFVVPTLFSIRELRVLKESMTNVYNDYLTGLLARHAIMKILEREISLSVRSGATITVGLLDVDYFKRVNDRYGHLKGDLALRHVAGKIRESCRPSDWVGRWGGEEFLLVCPELSRQDALNRLEAIRQRVMDPIDLSPSERLVLSVSVGVAFFPGEKDSEGVIGAADRALYRAKAAGRNRIELA